jgi:YggT family protein
MTGSFFSQALELILQAGFGLLTGALLLRFVLPLVGVSFSHPFGRFVLALTNWLVLPVRRLVFRVLPRGAGGSRFDWATLLCAYASEFVLAWLVRLVYGMLATTPKALGLVAGLAVIGLVRTAIVGLFVAVLLQAIISWVNPRADAMDLLDPLTRPFLKPIRRVLPLLGGIDLSPLVLCVVLQIMLLGVTYLQAAWVLFIR